MSAERTTGLRSGAEAAYNPECREEGRGGCCGGFKPLQGGPDGPASGNESSQTEFDSVSNARAAC